jgi:hypothetical protein
MTKNRNPPKKTPQKWGFLTILPRNLKLSQKNGGGKSDFFYN